MKKNKAMIFTILAGALCFALAACSSQGGEQGSGQGGGQGGTTEFQKFDDATLAADWAAAFDADNLKNFKVTSAGTTDVTYADPEVGDATTQQLDETVVVEGTKGYCLQKVFNSGESFTQEFYADWTQEPGSLHMRMENSPWMSESLDDLALETFRTYDVMFAAFRGAWKQFEYSEEKNGYALKEGEELEFDLRITVAVQTCLLQFKEGKLINLILTAKNNSAGAGVEAVTNTECTFTYGGQSVTFPDFGSGE